MHEPKFYIPEGNTYYTRTVTRTGTGALWNLDGEPTQYVPKAALIMADDHDAAGYSDQCATCQSQRNVQHGSHIDVCEHLDHALRLIDIGRHDTAADLVDLARNVYYQSAVFWRVTGSLYNASGRILAAMQSAMHSLRFATVRYADPVGLAAAVIAIKNDLAAEFEADQEDEGEPYVWGGEIYCRNPRGTGDIPF